MSQAMTRRLLPHQKEFVADFLRAGSAPFQQLVAPAGYGITTVTAALIQSLICEYTANRILVLASAKAMAARYEHLLHGKTGNVLMQLVDRRAFRELQARVPASVSPWEQPIVAVMNLDFAKREDIFESLITVRWDLVVVDESSSLADMQLALIERLVGTGVANRLLVLTRVVVDRPGHIDIPGLRTVNWYRDAVDVDGRSMFRLLQEMIRVEVVEYQRSPQEVEVLRAVAGLAEELNESHHARFIKAQMLQAASSSLYAIERLVLKQRNRLAHGDFLSIVDADSDTEEDLAQYGSRESTDSGPLLWKDAKAAYAKICGVLAALDSVADDTKLLALAALVDELNVAVAPMRLGVFSAYAATVDYLSLSLEETSGPIYRVSSRLEPEVARESYERFSQRGGTFVTTYASVKGLELQLRSEVLYDLPADPAGAVLVALTRFDGSSSEILPELFFLQDVSGAIPEEEDALGRFQELVERLT